MSMEDSHDSVGPFTGFGNFLRKELRDWWKSWRLIVVFAVMTLILSMMVFKGYKNVQEKEQLLPGQTKELIATRLLLVVFEPPPNVAGLVVQIFIMIFSTMGLMTNEKSSGTLAWNLSKPLGRTGLFVAKWLAATIMLWLCMCVGPVTVASICMKAYHKIDVDIVKMAPVVGASVAWIALWVLLSLTVSLRFQSQAAVAGIMIAFWAAPNLFGVLLRWVFGDEAYSYIVDRLATNSPFWSYELFADADLFRFGRPEPKNIFIYAWAVWMVVLSVISLRIFNRQEIGA